MSRHFQVRTLLFAGVSTLALTVGSAELRAADMMVPKAVLKAPPPAPTLGQLTMWMEGAAIWTGGSDMTEVGFPSIFPTFVGQKPRVGWEAAVGADWHFAGTPWHVSFDVRGGISKASDKNFSFHSTCAFFACNDGFGHVTATERFTERESHFVADFMIGRDFGFGLPGQGQVKVGIRVAELTATQNEQLNLAYAYNSNTNNHFALALGANIRNHSSFLGVGPRLAAEGSIPLSQQPWTFDWAGGVAALFGDRRFDANISGNFAIAGSGFTSPFATAFVFSSNLCNPSSHTFSQSCDDGNAVVFNADAAAALSYWFTPRAKLSGGFRFDGYWGALRTVAGPSSGSGLFNLHNENRFYYGPFLRLTGAF